MIQVIKVVKGSKPPPPASLVSKNLGSSAARKAWQFMEERKTKHAKELEAFSRQILTHHSNNAQDEEVQ